MNKSCVVAIGTFDGVHRGHQEILRFAVRRSRSLGIPSLALTFKAPPRLYFFPTSAPALLTTLFEKKSLLLSLNVKKVIALEFDDRLAAMSAEEFFKTYLVRKLRAQEIVVGYNFGFGKNRAGDARLLESLGKSHGMVVHVVPPVCERSVPISSGRIRKMVEEGDAKLARTFLGYPYLVTGRVIRGEGRGRTLGFPTSNLQVDPQKILPPGVFIVKVHPMPAAWGLCNIGARPTFRLARSQKVVEVYLPGFQGSLYGRNLRVEFIQRIRAEKKFNSSQDLIRQIKRDQVFLDKFLKRW